MIHKLTRFQIISFNVNQQVFNFCLPTAICSSCQFGMHPSPASNTGRSPEPPNARRLCGYSRKCPVHTCASRNGVLSWRNEVFASPIRLNYQTWTAAHQPRENTEIYWCFVCWLFSYIFLSSKDIRWPDMAISVRILHTGLTGIEHLLFRLSQTTSGCIETWGKFLPMESLPNVQPWRREPTAKTASQLPRPCVQWGFATLLTIFLLIIRW